MVLSLFATMSSIGQRKDLNKPFASCGCRKKSVFTSIDYKQHTSSQASLATRVRQWQEDSNFEIVCIDDKQHSGTLQTIAKDSMSDSFPHESPDMST